MNDYEKTRKQLENISPSFCLAKWKQATIYLQNGFTHSCHHPIPHKIPVKSLTQPSNLHNTETKIDARRQMIKGERPLECSVCWNMEDLGQTSDRIMKSACSWARPYLNEAKNNLRVNPSYLEVSFDSTCNLKCMYCSPILSSKWQEEVKLLGGYSNGHNDPEFIKFNEQWPLANRDKNPYKQAFWQWWPELYPDLKTFRITGGEPLLSKDTWRVFDWIIENPNPDLKLSINTNLSVDSKLIYKLRDYIEELSGKSNSFMIWTSAEAWGQQAEYIRHPFSWNLFLSNLDILTQSDVELGLMATVNVLSMESLNQIVDYFLQLNRDKRRAQVALPPIQHPVWLDPRLAPGFIKERMIKLLQEIVSKSYANEQDKEIINRLCVYLRNESPDYQINMNDLQSFITEYDSRRNLDFASTFPILNTELFQ